MQPRGVKGKRGETRRKRRVSMEGGVFKNSYNLGLATQATEGIQ